MFTGLIEGIGTVGTIIRAGGDSARITIDVPENIVDDLKMGDSVAVNGACLTATVINGRSVDFDVSGETLRRTTLGAFRTGQRVNIERAMQLGDRLGGHLVQGHVDCTGTVARMSESGGMMTLAVEVPESIDRYLVEKGSVAVDGISLTIASISGSIIELAIIPETIRSTNIQSMKTGDKVNLEADLIAKYVEKLVGGASKEGRLSMDRLKSEGF